MWASSTASQRSSTMASGKISFQNKYRVAKERYKRHYFEQQPSRSDDDLVDE